MCINSPLRALWLRSEAFLSSLPPPIESQARELLEFFKPHGAKVYAVGGSVRDFHLRRPLKDLDLEIHQITPALFESLMERLGAKGVGKSFFVYKWQEIDLSLPRLETKTALGHRGFEVKLASSPKEAAKRRDFTINALMLELESGELFDFFGGMDDLKRRRLHIISPQTFQEDSLRVLRAARFASELGFRIAPEDIPLMRSIEVDDLSKERIYHETKRLLEGAHLPRGVQALQLLALDQKIFHHPLTPALFHQFLKLQRRFRPRTLTHEYAFLLPLYLLWIIRFAPLAYLLESLSAMPKKEQRFLQKQRRFPKIIRDSFLVRLSLLYPLKEWLALHDPTLLQRAKNLGIFDQSFIPSTTPSKLLKEGYQGKSLGKEWQRRAKEEILTLFN